MKALEELVTMTKALIDQSQNNFDVILNVISTSIRVIREGNFNDTDLGQVGSRLAMQSFYVNNTCTNYYIKMHAILMSNSGTCLHV